MLLFAIRFLLENVIRQYDGKLEKKCERERKVFFSKTHLTIRNLTLENASFPCVSYLFALSNSE